MEIDEVTDRKSLEAYLKALPEEEGLLTTRRLAHRAAARVAPLGLQYFARRPEVSKRELTALPMWVALSYSGVAAVYPTPVYGRSNAAANAAANAAGAYIHVADAAANVAYVHAADAAANAAYANAADTYTAHASADAAATAANANAAFAWMRHDLRRFAEDPRGPLPGLWDGLDEPEALATAWTDAKTTLAADDKADWRAFILWYERLRAGRDIHAADLAKILDTLTQEEIEGDPAAVLPRFDKLLPLYESEDGATDPGNGTPISRAFVADFKFETLRKVMEVIGIDHDTAHLSEPKIVAAFLEKAETVQEMLQDFSHDAQELSGGGNYAGVLRRTSDRILQQFVQAQDKTKLPARRLVELAGKLERHSLEEKARADIGETLSEDLAEVLKRLKELCRTHFGPAYLALAPLSHLELGQIDPGEVIRIFDELLERLGASDIQDLAPLDHEALALFQAMIDDLRLIRAALAEADSDEMNAFLEARLAQEAGGIGVTFNRLYEKSVEGVGNAGKGADILIKSNERVSGLADILDSVKSALERGAGT